MNTHELDADIGAGTDFDYHTWDWTSEQRPPVDIWPDDSLLLALEGMYPPREHNASGQWQWYSETTQDYSTTPPTSVQVVRYPIYLDDQPEAPPTPLEIATQAQAASITTIRGIIQAIKDDDAANPLQNVPIIGTIIGVWNTLRQVNGRLRSLTAAVDQLSDVTGALITAVNESEQSGLASRADHTLTEDKAD